MTKNPNLDELHLPLLLVFLYLLGNVVFLLLALGFCLLFLQFLNKHFFVANMLRLGFTCCFAAVSERGPVEDRLPVRRQALPPRVRVVVRDVPAQGRSNNQAHAEGGA